MAAMRVARLLAVTRVTVAAKPTADTYHHSKMPLETILGSEVIVGS